MNPGICRELRGGDILGEILVGGGEIPRPPACGDTFEALDLPQRLELRTGDANPIPFTTLGHHRQMHHPVGALIRIRIRQQSVHNAENSGGGADAQSQRSNRGQGQGRALAQFAPGISKILQHIK